MVTKSLICQLVETQVVRYLAGEALSDEALRQLDDHIGGCPDCRSFLEAKKAELTSALRPTATPPKNPRERVLQAIVDARRLDEPAPAPRRAASASAPATSAANPAPKTVRPANLQWKPLALSVALALVLVAMSALTSNPATVFGRKASEVLASRAAPSETQAAAKESDPTPPSKTAASLTTAPNPGDPDFVGPAAPAPGESDASAETTAAEPNLIEAKPADGNPVESSPRNDPPRVAVRSRPRAPRVRIRRSPAPRPAPSQPTIRVYDANGKPL